MPMTPSQHFVIANSTYHQTYSHMYTVLLLFVTRNVCQECKCPREAHDIYHEDFVNIRERLGWEEPSDPDLQCDKDKSLKAGYTWIPPGLSDDLVSAYVL